MIVLMFHHVQRCPSKVQTAKVQLTNKTPPNNVDMVDVVTEVAGQDKVQLIDGTTPANVEMVDIVTEVAGHDKGKKQMVDPEDDLLYDPIKGITKKKEIWRLGVILDDMWTIFKGDTEDHIELLVRDAKGDSIQITIMHEELAAWKPRLTEGKTYYIRNFRVHDNNNGYRMTPHKFRLTVVSATRLNAVDICGIPKTYFRFKDFAEILYGKFDPNYVVDAIGVVHSIGKCVTATPTRKGQAAFMLKDIRNQVIDCTLWDSLSVEFLTEYNLQADLGPVVVIIKHARIKEPNGVYPLQLTNLWNGTKLILDTTIPEIQQFIKSLPKDVPYPSQYSVASNSTQRNTQQSGGSQFTSQYTTDEIFLKQARVMTLSEMKKLKQDTYCVTTATTDKIRVSNQGWYFRGCHDCSCKAEGVAPPYVCKKGTSL
ncbi:hypothetical protein QL285_079715 [Trifolium repens]|nr:hypothetical protein QL285_079715 [Trifolium repens]